MKRVLAAALACLIGVSAFAGRPEPAKTQSSDGSQAAIEKLMEDFKKALEKAGRETVKDAEDITDDKPNTTDVDAYLGYEVEFGTHEEKISFDYPKVTMREQKFSMHLPQVTGTNRHKISWDEPYWTTERRVIGHYWELIPRGGVPPRIEKRKKDIIVDVPVQKNRRREITIGYPKIAMKRTDWTMGVPEVTMDRQEIIYTVPDVTVRDLKTEGKKLEKRSQELVVKHNARMNEISEEFRKRAEQEVKPLLDAKFDGPIAQLQQQRKSMIAQFDSAIGQLKAAIKQLRENKTSEDDKYIADLEKNLKNTQQQKSKSVSQLDNSIKQLQEAKKTTWEKLLASFKVGN